MAAHPDQFLPFAERLEQVDQDPVLVGFDAASFEHAGKRRAAEEPRADGAKVCHDRKLSIISETPFTFSSTWVSCRKTSSRLPL